MKKSKVIVLINLMILTLILLPIIYIAANKAIYANRVKNYLLHERNYQKSDIASIKGVWGMKLPPFYATVIFIDEPDVEYIYFAHDGVLQFDYRITEEGQKKGISESDLQHIDLRKE